MTHQDELKNTGFWTTMASTEHELQQVFKLRASIYLDTGKAALTGRYDHALDPSSRAVLVGQGDRVIGTFSICNLRLHQQARRSLSADWNWDEGKLKNSLYVYFLGLRAEDRTAAALKFVFGEIFKYLVLENLHEIYIVADARLATRYRWLGMQPIGRQIPSSFPKSGKLTVMKTKQIFVGLYGFHADPIRWNWYLRTPTQELMGTGALPRSWAYRALFNCYSFFQPIAAQMERFASYYLRKNKASSATRRPHVRAV